MLSKSFGSLPVSRDVTLDLPVGARYALIGPNGAGKTTLINTVAGLCRARAGRLAIDGRDITSLAPHRFCDEGVAIVPEGRRLFTGMTVRENLELGSFRREAKTHRRESLDASLALFPALTAKLDQPAGELSGGQQQMVAIARALMARPRLLLLDEPSLGLSPLIVNEVFGAIRRINAEGMTLLLVEQNVAMALDVSHRAYVLEEGAIVAEGEPEALSAQPEIRRAYLGL
jgi:branched-chain amino acid transport system ATP-binding protein